MLSVYKILISALNVFPIGFSVETIVWCWCSAWTSHKSSVRVFSINFNLRLQVVDEVAGCNSKWIKLEVRAAVNHGRAESEPSECVCLHHGSTYRVQPQLFRALLFKLQMSCGLDLRGDLRLVLQTSHRRARPRMEIKSRRRRELRPELPRTCRSSPPRRPLGRKSVRPTLWRQTCADWSLPASCTHTTAPPGRYRKLAKFCPSPKLRTEKNAGEKTWGLNRRLGNLWSTTAQNLPNLLGRLFSYAGLSSFKLLFMRF